jgi:cell wall assembly regulator SMI1
MSKTEMTDEELLDQTLATRLNKQLVGAKPEDIATFETHAGVILPDLLKQLLTRSNGGEWNFARMCDEFIPNGKESAEQVWEHLVQPFLHEQNSIEDFRSLIGKILPLGDDYGGELIGLDYRQGPEAPYIVISDNHDYSTLDSYLPIAQDFREFLVDQFSQEPEERDDICPKSPLDEADQSAVAIIEKVLGDSSRLLDSYRRNSGVHRSEVWADLETEVGTFSLLVNRHTYAVTELGAFFLATNEGPTLIRVEQGKFVKETFKNSILASEALAKKAATVVELCGGEKCREGKFGDTLGIYETAFQKILEPIQVGSQSMAVVALQGDMVQRVEFSLQGDFDSVGSSQRINYLLRFGYDWFQ